MGTTTILWIGLTSTEEIFEKLVNTGYYHAPTFVAQRNLIEGIELITSNPVHSINGFMMESIPKCREVVTRGMQWSHTDGADDRSVPSLNVKYLDFIARNYFMTKEGKKWAAEHNQNENILIFVYAASEPYIATAIEIKKRIPTAEICLIIPDLPQFMAGSRIKKLLKNLRWRKLRFLIESCDKYILFSKHMANYLRLNDNKWIVVEGSIKNSEMEAIDAPALHEQKRHEQKIIIMYSGGLFLNYGIPQLLHAFSMIEDDQYELWLTGYGNSENLISRFLKKDKRIKHYGFISSRKEVLNMQQKATMLINTRMPTEEASSYCFPSKLFEYLLSGKPVLSFRIPGIPEEYYHYLIEIVSPDSNDIKKAICKVGAMSDKERDAIGTAGREFVMTQKNNIVQARKICQFVNLRCSE